MGLEGYFTVGFENVNGLEDGLVDILDEFLDGFVQDLAVLW